MSLHDKFYDLRMTHFMELHLEYHLNLLYYFALTSMDWRKLVLGVRQFGKEVNVFERLPKLTNLHYILEMYSIISQHKSSAFKF